MTIKFSDITGGGIPYGNTAGRPADPGIGKLYSNGETARLELYTQASGWQNIVQETPGVSSITGNYSEQTNSGVITISGTNFVSGCYATAIGSNGVQVDAASTTFNSLVQLTATFTGLSNANEPYDIKVTNPSNLFGLLPDALYINASPIWQTNSGSLGVFAEEALVSVSATAADSDSTITYSVASGSSLPSGITINSSTGVISGTLPNILEDTTYTFTINASDGVNTIPRTFSMTFSAAPIWSTPAGSLGTILERDLVAFQFSATEPTSTPITYSSSNIPSGLSLSSSGILSGVAPSVNSTTVFNFDVAVSDGINNVSRAFSLTVSPLTQVELLLVGGGGGGGSTIVGHHEGAGGGGAGGLYYTSTMPITGSHLVTVGAGGAGGQANNGTNGYTGENSVFGSKIALGGGAGGGQYANPSNNGVNGGSGGGWPGHAGFGRSTNTGLQPSSETGGLGNAGGTASAPGAYGGGGGGGAGGGGNNGSTSSGSSSGGGAGGAGVQYSITGTSQWYAAGGGGGAQQNGSGGSGGSGIGGNGSSTAGSAGTANTGSGGGASGASGGFVGGAGGSGVVIFAVPGNHTAQSIPGTLTYTRDATTRSGHTVYRFTAGSGTITL